MTVAVEAEGIVKVFGGSVRALDGVDLQVQSGKIFALLGPNGSGKTTLMRILTTQLPPTAGKASVMGLDIVKESAGVRRLVGYVPQEVSVWTDISGYENLLIYSKVYGIPSRERKRSIKEVLESVGLSEAANRLVRLYSGGMIRRLEIACALLISPEILFLDEPTIGLDPMARKAIWEKLVSFKKENGTSIFFNTHYMDEADIYADEIGIISRGKIVKTGSVLDLKRSVGGEAIHLQLSEGEGVNGEELTKAFREIPVVREASIEGPVLKVVASSAEEALPKIMRLLESLRVAVERVSMDEPTLDEVFFKYAGSWLDAGTRISEIKKVRERVKRG